MTWRGFESVVQLTEAHYKFLCKSTTTEHTVSLKLCLGYVESTSHLISCGTQSIVSLPLSFSYACLYFLIWLEWAWLYDIGHYERIKSGKGIGLSTAGSFKYVWPFSGHQVFKG